MFLLLFGCQEVLLQPPLLVFIFSLYDSEFLFKLANDLLLETLRRREVTRSEQLLESLGFRDLGLGELALSGWVAFRLEVLDGTVEVNKFPNKLD